MSRRPSDNRLTPLETDLLSFGLGRDTFYVYEAGLELGMPLKTGEPYRLASRLVDMDMLERLEPVSGNPGLPRVPHCLTVLGVVALSEHLFEVPMRAVPATSDIEISTLDT